MTAIHPSQVLIIVLFKATDAISQARERFPNLNANGVLSHAQGETER